MTTLIINEETPEARKFVEFAKTLPFVEQGDDSRDPWDEALDEGATTVEEFGRRFGDAIQRAYRP
jgi:hypothetical protein